MSLPQEAGLPNTGCTNAAVEEVPQLARKQAEARRVLDQHYPFKCCAMCGLQLAACLTIAHLDHNPGNNDPRNLARLCQTHHWMYDAGLYPIEAIRILQDHWQKVRGVPDHKPRMKEAGPKAALTRKRRNAARKAAAKRLMNADPVELKR